MKNLWLLLDVSNLCYRAWHVMPRLSYEGFPTEVIYGFLQSVKHLRELFSTDNLVFCFDHPVSSRRRLYPAYKEHRHRAVEEDPLKLKAREQMHIQINELRSRHLPKAGFSNIFYYHGMESDDIMAAIARSYAHLASDEVIMVTSDTDLYQCLAPNIMIYDPHAKKCRTEEWFRGIYKMPPVRWSRVKAVGGCKTDNVGGVPGMGEKTSVKYARNELTDKSYAFRAAISVQGQAIIKRNQRLVTLPFEDCPVPELTVETWNQAKWNTMLKGLGIRIR